MIIIEVAGHLGRDPEARVTPSGIKVTKLVVATNVRKAGKDETVWWNVTVWGDRYDKMITYLKKGSAVIIIGEMGKPEIYTDKEGRPQVSLELTAELIKFSPFGKPDGAKQEQSASGNTFSQPTNQYQNQSQNQSGYGSPYQQNEPSSMPYAGTSSGQGNTYSAHSDAGEESLPF